MSEPSPTPIAPASSSRWRALTLLLVLATVALALALWLLRSAIVTAMIRRSLLERGVTCEPFEVSASELLGELEIAPARCEVAEGSVAALAWDAPIRAHIEGSTMSSLEIDTLTITRRAGEHEAASASGGALDVWMQAPARIGGVVHFASRLSEIDSPALSVAHLSVVREGAEPAEVELEQLVSPARAAGTPVTIAIEGLALAAGAGPLGISAVPRLRDVAVQADRTHGSIEGTADASLTVPGLGSLHLGAIAEQRVVITAEQLDAQPRWNVEFR